MEADQTGQYASVEVKKMDDIQARAVANQVNLSRSSGLLSLIFVPTITAFLLVTLYVFC